MKEKKEAPKRTLQQYLILAIKGACMGAIDLVPGVSGGTVAFVTGIYQELVDTIKSINFTLFVLLFKGKFSTFWKQLNGSFLLPLACGILTSIFCFAKLIKYLIDTYPIPVWSLFSALVVASAIYVLKSVKKWSVLSVIFLIAGVVSAFFICRATPTETPNDYWFIFLIGVITICVWLLPGVSGSFVLILTAKYPFMLNAVSTFQWDVLLAFIAGAFIGIISFSHLLSWLLKNYYRPMVCLLAGFMFGSIERLWPWKEAFSETAYRNLWPSQYAANIGLPPQTFIAILFILMGFILVFGIEFLAKRMQQDK